MQGDGARLGRLAISVGPNDGEWLPTALARIAFEVGLPTKTLVGAVFRPKTSVAQLRHAGNFLRDTAEQDLGDALGWSREQLRTMTMKQFDGKALLFETDLTIKYTHLWARAAGTRFCPDCLRRDPGVFLCSWRLSWVFVCLEHRKVLRDACHKCGIAVADLSLFEDVAAEPGRCSAWIGRGKTGGPCRALLSEAWDEEELEIDAPILRVQRAIFDAMSRGKGIHLVNTLRCNAIALLKARAFGEISTLSATGDQEIRSLLDLPARVGTSAPSESLAMAAVAAASWRLYTDDEASVRDMIRTITFSHPVERNPRSGGHGPGSAALLLSYWPEATHPMQGRILRAIDTDLPHTQRIVWGTAVPEALEDAWFVTRRRASSSEIAPQRQKPQVHSPFLPPLLWRSWAAPWQVGPRGNAETSQRALALAVSLGHQRRLAELQNGPALEGLGRILRRSMLGTEQQATAIIRQIGELAIYLDMQGGPIRYDRRLHLPWQKLLPSRDWLVLAECAHELAGSGPKALNVRRYMYLRLTGQGVGDLPAEWALQGWRASAYNEFVLGLTAQFRDAIDRYLSAFLQAAEEPGPVTWAPPRWRPEGSPLARELYDIDLAPVHGLVSEGEVALWRLADAAGRSENHVEWALAEWPRDGGHEAERHDWLSGSSFLG